MLVLDSDQKDHIVVGLTPLEIMILYGIFGATDRNVYESAAKNLSAAGFDEVKATHIAASVVSSLMALKPIAEQSCPKCTGFGSKHAHEIITDCGGCGDNPDDPSQDPDVKKPEKKQYKM